MKCTCPDVMFDTADYKELERNEPELVSWIPSRGLGCEGGGVKGWWCKGCPFLSTGQPSDYERR